MVYTVFCAKIESMKKSLKVGLMCAGCLVLVGGLAEAKPNHTKGKSGKGHAGHSQKPDVGKGAGKGQAEAGKGKKDHNQEKVAVWKGKRFEDKERKAFLNYFDGFKNSPDGLPPGLAKNLKRGKPLPPGWQKKVMEGYIIEDEMRGFFRPLDEALFPNYKRVPDTKLYMYGDRMVRVYEPRRQVIDIFQIPGIRL
jgi:hypothetical protein